MSAWGFLFHHVRLQKRGSFLDLLYAPFLCATTHVANLPQAEPRNYRVNSWRRESRFSLFSSNVVQPATEAGACNKMPLKKLAMRTS